MDGQDLQLEELLVAEAVGLPLQRLDLVVRAFQRPCRDAAIIGRQDARAVRWPASPQTSVALGCTMLRPAEPSRPAPALPSPCPVGPRFAAGLPSGSTRWPAAGS